MVEFLPSKQNVVGPNPIARSNFIQFFTCNRIENLRYLCPNCHSQTETFRGRNKNTGKIKVTDKELLTEYKLCSNIRQTLLNVGLAPKGGNYKRLKKLLTNVGT